MDKVRMLKDIYDDEGWLVLKKGDIREVVEEREQGVYFIYHNDFDNLVTEFAESSVGNTFEFIEN